MKTASAPTGPRNTRKPAEAPLQEAVGGAPSVVPAELFRERLMAWYRQHARELPWRGIADPYATWLSEIMLQQTRVATVIDRYGEFLQRFPTLQALAAAEESEVLALWSGLGYYRRARMLHKAAQFVVRELDGELPRSSAELRTLPGIGDYTAAAIASIAFGESVAVVDGNVERVLLRIIGQPEQKTAASRARVSTLANQLVPPARKRHNAPGDHNQAMMELGATICVPRGPLCLQCPVVELCRTRGEHVTLKREKQQTRRVAHLLALRQVGPRTEVLLEQRSQKASLMAGMFELPPLPLNAVVGHPHVLRVKHSITNTVYEVEVYPHGEGDASNPAAGLRRDVAASESDLHWAATRQLNMLPLTGLARKCLMRLQLMDLH